MIVGVGIVSDHHNQKKAAQCNSTQPINNQEVFADIMVHPIADIGWKLNTLILSCPALIICLVVKPYEVAVETDECKNTRIVQGKG